MASEESINVEFGVDSTARKSASAAAGTATASGGGGSGGGGDFLDQLRYHLDFRNHTLLENTLASLVFVLFVLVIALAATHGGGGGGIGDSLAGTCQSQLCLLRSASTAALANLSENPCDDFYKYACGLTPYTMRIGPSLLERTQVGELGRLNEDRLETVLRSPVTRDTTDSYERKLKTFFATCVNDFLTERIRGAPLAMYLRADLYPMNGSVVDKFDLNEMLLKSYMIYGADMFFEYMVTTNFLDDDKYTISISKGGLEMPVSSYLDDTQTALKHQVAYREYIRTVMAFLVADAEPGTVAPGELGRVDDFVTDVMEIETELAKINRNSVDPDKPPLDPNNMPTLLTMDSTYSAISWSRFFVEAFRPNVPEGTRVAVQNPDYLSQMSEYIKTRLPSTNPGFYKRKLSNYMNWRVISRHASDLSSNYVHARRVFQSVLSVRAQVYESRFDVCFRKARHFMRQGVSALFVADHLSESSKVAVDTMYRSLQKELTASVDRLSWVDSGARAKAKVKVGAIQDRIGYSATEVDDAYLDKYYETLNAGKDDYLLDMTVSYENFRRERQGRQIGKQPDKEDWDGATYDTNLHMNNEKVQLTIPAGVIQWPFFTAGLPGYINFATIGQMMAAELVKSIDATGQLFDKDGKTNPMWSGDTLLNYVQRATCLNQTFSALRTGPYVTPSGSQYVSIDRLISRHLRNVIAGADGLRLALRTYQGLGAAESPLPMAQLNIMQTFFVAWSQNYCYSRDPQYSVTKAETLRSMPEEAIVNGILSAMPEFAQTFSCPSSSKMAKPPCHGVFYL